MTFLIFLVVTVILLIVPIKLAANWVGAGNTGTLSCVIALIVASATQHLFDYLFPGTDKLLGLLISFPLSALVYSLILSTSFVKGLIIAVVQIVLTLVLGFVLLGTLSSLLPSAA